MYFGGTLGWLRGKFLPPEITKMILSALHPLSDYNSDSDSDCESGLSRRSRPSGGQARGRGGRASIW